MVTAKKMDTKRIKKSEYQEKPESKKRRHYQRRERKKKQQKAVAKEGVTYGAGQF